MIPARGAGAATGRQIDLECRRRLKGLLIGLGDCWSYRPAKISSSGWV
jgi:hypothetical protein